MKLTGLTPYMIEKFVDFGVIHKKKAAPNSKGLYYREEIYSKILNTNGQNGQH